MIIKSRYHGICNTCGASVKPGDKVNWLKHNGVVVCQACKAKRIASETVTFPNMSFHVSVFEKGGQISHSKVTPCSAEIGHGSLNFNREGNLAGIAGCNPLHCGDLADYIDQAHEALDLVLQTLDHEAQG
jgi:hypothetical protein